jgi:hypothetical protein
MPCRGNRQAAAADPFTGTSQMAMPQNAWGRMVVPKKVSTCRRPVNRRVLNVLGLGVRPVLSMGFWHCFAIVAEPPPRVRQYRHPRSRLRGEASRPWPKSLSRLSGGR